MSKKRTKKDKVHPKHPFLISWEGKPNQDPLASAVKGQTGSVKTSPKKEGNTKNRANLLDKEPGLASIKREIVKSLILVSFVLAVEIVLYFFWS